MSDSPRIRPAQLDDAADIARLSGELGYPALIEEIRWNLSTLLASSKCLVAVASKHGNQLSGWVVVERRVSLESGEKAEITGLVVTSSARREGIGKALVSFAEQWSAQLGLSSVRVRSNVARTESHDFYQHLGFMRKKTQHVYEKQLPAR